MKKAVAFSMAAFYLLLTTGMFVCIVHCTAESLTVKSGMASSHNHCKKDKDCDCCKKHGSYVIRENIKPGSDFRVLLPASSICYEQLPDLIYQQIKQNNISCTNSHAPPGKSGKVISIRFHSLQI